MIALISFDNSIVMAREEAENLGLLYEECDRVGIRSNQIQQMNSHDYYKDELTEVDGVYFNSEKKIDNYYIYQRTHDNKDWVYIKQNNHLVELESFIFKCRYKFYIEKALKSEEPSMNNIHYILNMIAEKANQINKMVDVMKSQTFNQKVNVHIGGGLIATYNELCLKEDCCTDALQTELNNGWRIIAVCVQPDQRRPDYILGRYNPELNVKYDYTAKR